MTNDNSFVIGVGSQRAGSTLLHKILDQTTEIFMHPIKELHYFDTLYGIRNQEVLTKFSEQQLKRISAKDPHSKKETCEKRANQILSSRTVEHVDYIDLFRPCLMDNPVVGEITPEYMILPEEGIKNMAQTIGSDAKIILLTRDPIQRFISSFKLLKAYGNETPDFTNFEHDIIKVFDEMPTWIDQQKALNDYSGAELKFKMFFNNMITISYENLTSDPLDEMKKLQDFLDFNIDFLKVKNIMKSKVNQIVDTKQLHSNTIKRLEKKLI